MSDGVSDEEPGRKHPCEHRMGAIASIRRCQCATAHALTLRPQRPLQFRVPEPSIHNGPWTCIC